MAELQPPVGLAYLVNSISEPSAVLAKKKKKSYSQGLII